jgi:hypothetical protein
LTPITNVASTSVAGAEMMTLRAPGAEVLAALSRVVKRPVDSMTTSTFSSPQGSSAGLRSASTLMVLVPHGHAVVGDRHRHVEAALGRVVPQEVGVDLG